MSTTTTTTTTHKRRIHQMDQQPVEENPSLDSDAAASALRLLNRARFLDSVHVERSKRGKRSSSSSSAPPPQKPTSYHFVEWKPEKQRKKITTTTTTTTNGGGGSGNKETCETKKPPPPMTNSVQPPSSSPPAPLRVKDEEALTKRIEKVVVVVEDDDPPALHCKEQEGNHRDKRLFTQQKNKSRLEQQKARPIQDTPSALAIESASENVQAEKKKEAKKNETDEEAAAFKKDSMDEDDHQVLNEEDLMKKDPSRLKPQTLLRAYIKLKRIYIQILHEKEEIILENKALKKRIEQTDSPQTKPLSNLESAAQAKCQATLQSSSSSFKKTNKTAHNDDTKDLFNQQQQQQQQQQTYSSPILQNNEDHTEPSLNHSSKRLNHEPFKTAQQQDLVDTNFMVQQRLMERCRLAIENAAMKKTMGKLIQDYKRLYNHHDQFKRSVFSSHYAPSNDRNVCAQACICRGSCALTNGLPFLTLPFPQRIQPKGFMFSHP